MKKTPSDNQFYRDIKKHYDLVVCFSPHLDDAVFSAGGMLAELSKHMPVNVVNVFTNAGDAKSTLSAKQFLKQSKVATPQKLFKMRIDEDKQSLSLVDANIIDLDYTDAMWRKKRKSLFPIRLAGRVLPEFISLYPTYRYHVIKGRIHDEDADLVIELARRFRNIVPDPSRILVLAPVGVGNHVDHCIVRNACRLAFGKNVYYWLDFPYFTRRGVSTENTFMRQSNLSTHSFPVDVTAKSAMCERYLSQYDIVIPDKEVLRSSEQFYKEK